MANESAWSTGYIHQLMHNHSEIPWVRWKHMFYINLVWLILWYKHGYTEALTMEEITDMAKLPRTMASNVWSLAWDVAVFC